MDTFWSDNIQGVMTLYLSRALRFDELFFARYEPMFALDKEAELNILELGCGPGALAEALKRRYPKAHITAVDRDGAFIAFSREHIPGVEFTEADIAALPFPDDTFDAVISYTVQEHIEPGVFWGEQRRILKPGGVCLCLSARRGITRTASCLEMTEAEKAFWESFPDSGDELAAHGIGRYALSEAELPAMMEAHGFKSVTTGYAVIDLTPDDPRFSPQMAERMIEAQHQNDLEAIGSMHSDHAGEAVAAVNAKYAERLRLYRAGIKQWDTAVSVTMIVRGKKGTADDE